MAKDIVRVIQLRINFMRDQCESNSFDVEDPTNRMWTDTWGWDHCGWTGMDAEEGI